MAHGINFPPNQFWYCTLVITINWMAQMCSTLFILNMTFDRCYSILRPHKAASFNTVKRARIAILCSIMFSIIYNSPHLFISSDQGGQCVPYGNAMTKVIGKFYYWLSYGINFGFPFILLLIMNGFIIHTLRTRSTLNLSQGQIAGQRTLKKSDSQIYVTLLLITFGYFIFIIPAYMMFLYTHLVDYQKSAYRFAGCHLFFSVAQKALYTNYAINSFSMFCLATSSEQICCDCFEKEEVIKMTLPIPSVIPTQVILVQRLPKVIDYIIYLLVFAI